MLIPRKSSLLSPENLRNSSRSPYVELRAANSLGQFDLVVISARLDPRSLAPAWFYVPRLLHDSTRVFQERLLPGGRPSLQLVGSDEIGTLAAASVVRPAA